MRARILWGLAQVFVTIVLFGAFFNFAPWIATEPIGDAPPGARATLPAGCPAFSVNHGTYICEWHGTATENPLGFYSNAALIPLCCGFLLFTGFTGRGFRNPQDRNVL